MRLPLAAAGRGGAYCGRIERVGSGSLKRTLRDGEGERVAPSVANVTMEESLTVPFPANCWISQRIGANCSVINFSVGVVLTSTLIIPQVVHRRQPLRRIAGYLIKPVVV